jgi:hypothetical protein
MSLYQPSTAELEAVSTVPRFAIMQVREGAYLWPEIIQEIRSRIAVLQLPDDAVILLQLTYNNPTEHIKGASVDLLAAEPVNNTFTSLADNQHVLTLFTTGLDRKAAAEIRGIVNSYPVIMDSLKVEEAKA